MSTIYNRFGVTPIINARGTNTKLGGSLMTQEVLNAMQEAAGHHVVLEELQDAASERIAKATGAEAGMITGGAASGLQLAAAACMTGLDSWKVEQLPATEGLKDEFIMFRAHRNGYDQSIRSTGAQIVDIGYPHRTPSYHLQGAISDQTAGVIYLISSWRSRGALSLRETVEVAHSAGVPVIVDAAGSLPPLRHLTEFVAAGADLVSFSGGKGLGAPAGTGILAGRADLIEIARLNASPNHAIGRVSKVGKEDMIGLLVALERFSNKNHEEENAAWRSQCEYIGATLSDLEGITISYQQDDLDFPTPQVEVVMDSACGLDAPTLVKTLQGGNPRVFVHLPNGPRSRPNSISISVYTIKPGDEITIARIVRDAISDQIGSRERGDY